jgi:ABC-2 type transport system permease protein
MSARGVNTHGSFGHALGRVRHLARAYPTLVRVGVSDLVAYRAEFLVWILTMNLPLIMMALWSAVAADGPIGRFGQAEFVAYYLAMFLVRILTGGWLVWELTMELKRGTLATRLMRPLHPLWAYSAEQLAAVPIRTLLLSPVLLLFYWIAGARLPLHDPARLAIVAASLVGAWLLLFLVMAIIGSLAAYVESALSVFDLWLSAQAILSGFLIPLELMPAWVNRLARVLPFRYLLGFPVEVLIGLEDNRTALHDLGRQWLFVAGALLLTIVAWRRALRRFAAFGG